MKLSLAVFGFVVALAACGGGDQGKAPPDKPFTGAPVAVVVDEIKPPETLAVSVYNFSDKTIAGYWFLIRYLDKDGNVLKVRPGTALEKDTDHMSMSGYKHKVGPKAWKSLEIDMLEIPAGTEKAEVLVKHVTAVAADGQRLEDEPLWKLEGIDWPAK